MFNYFQGHYCPIVCTSACKYRERKGEGVGKEFTPAPDVPFRWEGELKSQKFMRDDEAISLREVLFHSLY